MFPPIPNLNLTELVLAEAKNEIEKDLATFSAFSLFITWTTRDAGKAVGGTTAGGMPRTAFHEMYRKIAFFRYLYVIVPQI